MRTPVDIKMTHKWYIIILLILIIAALYGTQKAQQHLPQINRIIIEKQNRKMIVFHDDKFLKEYKISLGFQPIGPKQTQGDGKTPEGKYQIISKNAHSQFYRSLKISYPNERDRQQATAQGENSGNDIMIHGLRNGLGWLSKFHTFYDWTRGCIAVTNPEIEEIYAATAIGTPVEINP